MDSAVHALSQRTKSLAIGTVGEGKVWHSGYANVFLNPEFSDTESSGSLFTFLEEARRMHELFFERMTGLNPIEILFGEELGWSDLPCLGVVGTRFNVQNHDCALGVVGPSRLEFSTVVPILRYFRGLIQEISGR
jgi:transcriptional regulator of heat shock response